MGSFGLGRFFLTVQDLDLARRCGLEDDLSILQQEMRRLSFQIDAHHREDDARREKNQGRGDDMEGSQWGGDWGSG